MFESLVERTETMAGDKACDDGTDKAERSDEYAVRP